VDNVVIYNRADTAAFKLQNLVVRVGNALPAAGGPGGLLTTNILCGMFAGNVAAQPDVQVRGAGPSMLQLQSWAVRHDNCWLTWGPVWCRMPHTA
jgi:hypothetical protein